MPPPIRLPNAEEKQVLDHLHVRIIREDEPPGWTRLDDPSGFSRVAEDFHERRDRPKQLWVRALDATALASLRAQTLPTALAPAEVELLPRCSRCRVLPRRMESLSDRLPEVKDPRDVKGRWHPWRAVPGMIVLAKVCGAHLGQHHIDICAAPAAWPWLAPSASPASAFTPASR